jgi:two-component system response regulator
MPDPNTIVDILLVEDNPTDAELSIRTLRKHKLTNNLVWLKDGQEALDFLFSDAHVAAASGGQPKVVLLDLRLPKVDGLEVLRRLKADERTKMIPVVVLTSSKEDRDVIESYKLGVNSFISKPVGFEEFCATVERLGLYWLLVNRPPRAAV